MHIDSLLEIKNSTVMNNFKRTKNCIDIKHLSTHKRDDGFGHVLIIWINTNMSDKKIDNLRKRLSCARNSTGEILDINDIIKFYGTVKQLVLS